MNRAIRKYGFWIFILVTLASGVRSQDVTVGYPVESLQVLTDRTMYITGEKICFSAMVFLKDEYSRDDPSRILYCELITPDGTRISGGKYLIEGSMAQGSLSIMDDAITGIYYLKSYTRWMRNGGPVTYHYTRLKIINPRSAEVLSGNDNPAEPQSLSAETGGPPFRVSADKSLYHQGEEIILQLDRSYIHDFEGKLVLSVVPFPSRDSISFHRDSISFHRDSISSGFQYYPETRGISISGRLLEDSTGNPVPNALVNLSIIGDKDVMAIRTNDAGRFYFSLPGYTGNRDIFLCGEEINGIPTSIYIDNDFCPEPVDLPSPAFQLTDEEISTAFSMAVNQQINAAYKEAAPEVKPGEMINESSFYGKPDEVLIMEKYIDLPSVEEYFSELLGAVNVRKYAGRNVFRFNSGQAEMTIYDPLVLIDMVAVNDIEKILAMSPRLIDRIELINAPYIKGNITYGGIISFFSKNNDFAGIDLPSSGTFINYEFLEDIDCAILQGPFPENTPDTRNTVFWDPDVRLNKEGNGEIRFTAPATPGRYVIMLRGLGFTGEVFTYLQEIEVSD